MRLIDGGRTNASRRVSANPAVQHQARSAATLATHQLNSVRSASKRAAGRRGRRAVSAGETGSSRRSSPEPRTVARIRSSARTGSRRWSRRAPQKARSTSPPIASGLEVVDVAGDALGAGAERVGGGPEAAAELHPPLLARCLEPGPVSGRPLVRRDPLGVDRDDLGAAPLHLERPEAVEGADVERAQAGEVAREDAFGRLAQVDLAGGDDAGRELDRVVPGRVRAQGIARLGGRGVHRRQHTQSTRARCLRAPRAVAATSSSSIAATAGICSAKRASRRAVGRPAASSWRRCQAR